MLLIVTASFLFVYAALIGFYLYQWLQTEEFEIGEEESVSISVVIAARNEAENIGTLLRCLQAQSYPEALYEVIVVDDFSTDDTARVLRSFEWQLLRIITPGVEEHKSSKKICLEAGIKAATGDLIVVTDADCVVPEHWLRYIAGFQQQRNAVFIAAPVKLKTYTRLLSIFQSLDFITLQGITAASVRANFHSMCNGANLAYLKTAFFEVNGFAGIDKIASGDDMLLMYKIWSKHPDRVHYLKTRRAIVETTPMETWKSFFYQRVRWSSKATYYQDRRVSAVLLFVYLLNFLFFVLLVVAFCWPGGWTMLMIYLVGKVVIELPFVYIISRFYGEEKWMIFFPFLQPLHITYVVVVGLLSQFGAYEWKGRRTK
ncbi:MAG TPA: glycosyltransferase [Chitinophagaceae bacterium]|nr:glycosyltransferase [Chitinophagaceae bacterium]